MTTLCRLGISKRAAQASIFMLILALPAASVSAAAVYEALVWNAVNNTVMDLGSIFATGFQNVAGSTQQGTVVISGTRVDFNSNVSQGGGTSPFIHTQGKMDFGDVVFTDPGNPGNNGMIDVSLNYLLDVSANGPGFFGVDLDFGLNPAPTTGGSNLGFSDNLGPGVYNATTGTIQVQLNTIYNLGITVNMKRAGCCGQGNVSDGIGYLELASTPFNLLPQYTVDSVSAGIVNNSLTIPVPPAFWLLASSLLVLARRRQK